MLHRSLEVVNLDTSWTGNSHTLGPAYRVDLVDVALVATETVSWSTRGILFDVLNFPNVYSSVLSGASQEKLGVVGHCDCIHGISVLVKRRH